MKALVYDAYGPPEGVRLADLPIPEPDAGEVRIRVAYAGVNPIDWKIGEGRLSAQINTGFPMVLGREISGTIDCVGDGCRDFSAGDHVFASLDRPGGGFAEYAVVPERNVAKAPGTLSPREAAAIPLTSLASWQALVETAELAADETVFVLSGAGGTGSFAIQLAKSRRARVVTTCSAKNREFVSSLGADKVVDYASPNPIACIRAACPGGLDTVFSNALGDLHRRSYELLRPGGMIVTIGEPPIGGAAECLGVREVDLVVRPDGQALSAIAWLIDRGEIRPPPVREFRLEDAAHAFRASMTGHVRGKIVLSIGKALLH
ncbi:MAG: NADP-dependent oxidoreductase [Rhodobacteraceae bacterium]|nr:NADP-dependent oxidoreductase [Paracoccaceae bacterium]